MTMSTSLGKTQGSYKFARSTVGGVDLAGSVALNYTPTKHQHHHDQLRVNLELNVSL